MSLPFAEWKLRECKGQNPRIETLLYRMGKRVELAIDFITIDADDRTDEVYKSASADPRKMQCMTKNEITFVSLTSSNQES